MGTQSNLKWAHNRTLIDSWLRFASRARNSDLICAAGFPGPAAGARAPGAGGAAGGNAAAAAGDQNKGAYLGSRAGWVQDGHHYQIIHWVRTGWGDRVFGA